MEISTRSTPPTREIDDKWYDCASALNWSVPNDGTDDLIIDLIIELFLN
jgi:hypothetical protein